MSKFGVQGPDLKFTPLYQITINTTAYQSTRLIKKLLSTTGSVICYYLTASHKIAHKV